MKKFLIGPLRALSSFVLLFILLFTTACNEAQPAGQLDDDVSVNTAGNYSQTDESNLKKYISSENTEYIDVDRLSGIKFTMETKQEDLSIGSKATAIIKIKDNEIFEAAIKLEITYYSTVENFVLPISAYIKDNVLYLSTNVSSTESSASTKIRYDLSKIDDSEYASQIKEIKDFDFDSIFEEILSTFEQQDIVVEQSVNDKTTKLKFATGGVDEGKTIDFVLVLNDNEFSGVYYKKSQKGLTQTINAEIFKGEIIFPNLDDYK